MHFPFFRIVTRFDFCDWKLQQNDQNCNWKAIQILGAKHSNISNWMRLFEWFLPAVVEQIKKRDNLDCVRSLQVTTMAWLLMGQQASQQCSKCVSGIDWEISALASLCPSATSPTTINQAPPFKWNSICISTFERRRQSDTHEIPASILFLPFLKASNARDFESRRESEMEHQGTFGRAS